MMNYQTPVGVRDEEGRERWPAEDGAGPFAVLGIFVLFVVGMFLFSSIVGQFGGEPAAVYPSLAVPPLAAMFIAYRLRSWWWVLYTTLPPVLVGVLFLFGGDWITAIGGVAIALGGINAALMAVATAIGQSRYRAQHPSRVDWTGATPIQKQTIPPQKNPLMEW